MYALSISDSNFCRGDETSDLGVVGERIAVIMGRKGWREFTECDVSRTKTREITIILNRGEREAVSGGTTPSTDSCENYTSVFLAPPNVFDNLPECLSLWYILHTFQRWR